ncbi:MAG: sensor histidine kinase [Actinomycetota bacterium]
MYQNDHELIFRRFERGDTTAVGTGIGLSLVATFAEMHGGRAWVEERPGGGASFRVALPRGEAALGRKDEGVPTALVERIG